MRETISMQFAIEVAGTRPEWGRYICKRLDGGYNWVNEQHYKPEGDSMFVAASFGNLHPKYYNVEGLPEYVESKPVKIEKYDGKPLSITEFINDRDWRV